LGLIVIFFRRWIPESPRWLMIHGRNHQAEEIVADVERKIYGARDLAAGERRYGELFPTRIRTRTHTPWREIWNAIVHEHRRRSFLAFVLMSTQAFFYNAIFFTYALVLMRFYGVQEQDVGGYLLPFALGNSWNGDCNFLCTRNPGRWRGCAATVRLDHRNRIEHSIVYGVFDGCGGDGFCGGDGSMDRRFRRATLARANRRTAIEQGFVI